MATYVIYVIYVTYVRTCRMRGLKMGAYMNREHILKALRAAGDQHVSGASMSKKLNLSRSAVWKHIEALRDAGYRIEAVSNKGYRLLEEPSGLDAMKLSELGAAFSFLEETYHFERIDSTNLEAKRYALSQHPRPALFVADEQTQGRGRLGRSWQSDAHQGLWMSLFLKPNIPPERTPLLTLVGAAAMYTALSELTGAPIGIKWPNDLILNGQKVCGILTELGAEFGNVHYVILGIGVNIGHMAFEADLQDKAISLASAGYTVDTGELLTHFLQAFETQYARFLEGDVSEVLQLHRLASVTLGERVYVDADPYRALGPVEAIDLTPEGHLVIRDQGGTVSVLQSGEVSVRGINGYVG